MKGLFSGLYNLIPRPFPNPGTGNFSFQSNQTLPEFSLRGRGRPVINQFSMSAPQIIQTPAVTLEGYGGLFTGQYAITPLYDPNADS